MIDLSMLLEGNMPEDSKQPDGPFIGSSDTEHNDEESASENSSDLDSE